MKIRWIKERERAGARQKKRRKGSSGGREMVGLWSVVAHCHFKSEFTVRGDGL